MPCCPSTEATSTATQAPTNAESASEENNSRKTSMITPARNRKFNTSHSFEPLRENIVLKREKKEKKKKKERKEKM